MKSPTMRIALLAIMIAVTTVFTVIPKIPIPGTEGYLNLSDVAITFAGVAFGPIVGLVAGGVGPALADLMGGYGQWAGISLLAHGLEGFLIGLFARQGRRWSAVLGWAIGALFMVLPTMQVRRWSLRVGSRPWSACRSTCSRDWWAVWWACPFTMPWPAPTPRSPSYASRAAGTRNRPPVLAIELRDLYYRYPAARPHEVAPYALQGIDLEVEAGEFVALMGHTGPASRRSVWR